MGILQLNRRRFGRLALSSLALLSCSYRADGASAPPEAIRRRTIRSFGAAANGLQDDADAIDAAIKSGLPLDWEDGIYRVSRRVGLAAGNVGAVDWYAAGAWIVLDPNVARHEPAVLHVRLAPGGRHRIVGTGLEVDGQLNASIGAYFDQPSVDTVGIFHAEGLAARNIRSAPGQASASGVRVRGGFAQVLLFGPAVRNVRMGIGAGVSGQIGVNGIMITRGNMQADEGSPHFVRIVEPFIEDITSDDLDHVMDMDGIAIFGQMHNSPDRLYDECLVQGGLWRNCWGRDIKIQMGGGRISGGKFEHFTAPEAGTAKASIAFQWGLGTVENTHHLYDGVAPSELINFATGKHGVLQPGKYCNSKYEIRNAVAKAICRTYPRRADFPSVKIQDISGVGEADFAMVCHLPERPMTVELDKVSGRFRKGLVQARGTPGVTAGQLKVVASACVSGGATVPLVVNNLSKRHPIPKILSRRCEGFFPI